jgi:hypothetical protein
MDRKVLDALFHQLYNERLTSGGAPTGRLLEVEEDLHCYGVAAWKQAGNHGYAFRLEGETVTHFWYLGKGVV